MNAIGELLSRVIAVNKRLTEGVMIREVVEDSEAWIVDMNVEEQLYKRGVDSLNESIMGYRPYTQFTIRIKEQKGQPTDRVTLRDTGDFESSFYVVADNMQFDITASDEKTGELIRKYGREIFGLTEENIQRLIEEYLLPGLVAKIRDEL